MTCEQVRWYFEDHLRDAEVRANRGPVAEHASTCVDCARYVEEQGALGHNLRLVRESVLSPGVRVNSWSRVERSVIMHNTRIGRYAVVKNAILDKNVEVPEGAVVGVDKDHDRARGFVVSEGGITVVGKGQAVSL